LILIYQIEYMRKYPSVASSCSLQKVAGYNSNWCWRRIWTFSN